MAGCLNRLVVSSLLLGVSAVAMGQATVVEDGKRRYAFGAGTSWFSGNTTTRAVNLSLDAVRATQREKLDLLGRGQLSRNLGESTGEAIQLAVRYQREINPRVYGFGQTEALRDTRAKVGSRFSIANGSGYRLIRTDDNKWDAFAGAGYSRDRYTEPIEFGSSTRQRYSRFELLLGQESSHQFNDNTTLKQRLTIFPNMSETGEYRAEFDLAVSVAMSQTMSLTTTLSVRHNSQPGTGLKPRDTSFVTALSWKTN